MRPLAVSLATLFLLAAGRLHAEQPADFFFKEGDRVVFLGDSITEQYHYSSVIELYLTTRFPRWNLTFLNAGIGGDTATGGARRFREHVLAEKPTAVTINFGMNDAGYGAFDQGRQGQYLKNTEAMLEAARRAGVRVALLSPNAVDRRVQSRFNLYLETQKRFYAPLAGLAKRHGAAFVDQYALTRAALEKMEADGAEKVRPFGDGFHTSSPGGLLMAHAILTGLGAPALVSDVTVDMRSGKAEAKGCRVEKLRTTGSVTFERTDEALPLPVQKDWLSVLPYVNGLKDLNAYGLKVTGLAPGKYVVRIDGKDVGIFPAQELAEGVNLGNATAGPVHEQAQKVFEAINDKNRVVHQRFRGVVMYQAPDWLADVAAERKPQELARRLEQIKVRQAQVYQLAQPVPRRFEVKMTK